MTELGTENNPEKSQRRRPGQVLLAVLKQRRFWAELGVAAAALIGLWLWTVAVHDHGEAEGRAQPAPPKFLVVDQATVNSQCVTVIGVAPGGSWWAMPAGATAGYPERVDSKDVGVNGCRAAPTPR